VNVHRVPAWPAGSDLHLAPGIARWIRRKPGGIVHVQGFHTLVAPLAMLSSIAHRIPFVVTFHSGGHSSQLRHRLRPLQQRALRPLLKRASRLIGVSAFEKELFRSRLGLPAELFAVVPNGVDKSTPDDVQEVEVDNQLIVSIGRAERYKGHQRVVEALPDLIKVRPGLRLRVLGSGPDEQKLRRLADRLGVSDRVEICGVRPTDRPELVKLLRSAALIVSLSTYEAHSIAALEAVNLGRPTLVAASSGLSEFAERGLARGVDPKASASAIAGAILEQLENPIVPAETSLATWDDCAESLLSIYQSILGERDEAAASQHRHQ
jgi:glycosyltransferase involved in cell wall biosynthesis